MSFYFTTKKKILIYIFFVKKVKANYCKWRNCDSLKDERDPKLGKDT